MNNARILPVPVPRAVTVHAAPPASVLSHAAQDVALPHSLLVHIHVREISIDIASAIQNVHNVKAVCNIAEENDITAKGKASQIWQKLGPGSTDSCFKAGQVIALVYNQLNEVFCS